MAAPITNNGYKSDKLVTDALRVAIMREAKDADGKPTKRLLLMADKVARQAAEGERWAVEFVTDRLEGRALQAVSLDVGASLLSVLDELERRADMRVSEGKIIDANPQRDGDNSTAAMLIEHGDNSDNSV